MSSRAALIGALLLLAEVRGRLVKSTTSESIAPLPQLQITTCGLLDLTWFAFKLSVLLLCLLAVALVGGAVFCWHHYLNADRRFLREPLKWLACKAAGYTVDWDSCQISVKACSLTLHGFAVPNPAAPPGVSAWSVPELLRIGYLHVDCGGWPGLLSLGVGLKERGDWCFGSRVGRLSVLHLSDITVNIEEVTLPQDLKGFLGEQADKQQRTSNLLLLTGFESLGGWVEAADRKAEHERKREPAAVTIQKHARGMLCRICSVPRQMACAGTRASIEASIAKAAEDTGKAAAAAATVIQRQLCKRAGAAASTAFAVARRSDQGIRATAEAAKVGLKKSASAGVQLSKAAAKLSRDTGAAVWHEGSALAEGSWRYSQSEVVKASKAVTTTGLGTLGTVSRKGMKLIVKATNGRQGPVTLLQWLSIGSLEIRNVRVTITESTVQDTSEPPSSTTERGRNAERASTSRGFSSVVTNTLVAPWKVAMSAGQKASEMTKGLASKTASLTRATVSTGAETLLGAVDGSGAAALQRRALRSMINSMAKVEDICMHDLFGPWEDLKMEIIKAVIKDIMRQQAASALKGVASASMGVVELGSRASEMVLPVSATLGQGTTAVVSTLGQGTTAFASTLGCGTSAVVKGLTGGTKVLTRSLSEGTTVQNADSEVTSNPGMRPIAKRQRSWWSGRINVAKAPAVDAREDRKKLTMLTRLVGRKQKVK